MPEVPTSRSERSPPTVTVAPPYQLASAPVAMSVADVSGGVSERMKRSPSKRSSEVTRSSPGGALACTVSNDSRERDFSIGP